ncbi:heterokaryon incompatibility protein-domain-containing protein [Podospora fimiseda]|uniref:Heterokaryon incompatibility protein-domain-containing protein n=1 Tax=Podospora fimiseda TaxID=252190 RepID=A0AAN7BND7_9PEZI|nr:heterokaryon incompatibility protein-domain-containing protein [Podospora fimiseda]
MSPPHSQSICDDCTGIFSKAASLLSSMGKADQGHGIPIDKSYQARLESRLAQAACNMCSLISNTIPSTRDPLTLDTGATAEFTCNLLPENEGNVSLRLRKDRVKEQIFSMSPAKLRIREFRRGTDPRVLSAPTTWSSEALGQIQEWLNTCLSSHTQCGNKSNPSGQQPWLPRRLIDVWSTTQTPPKDFEQLSPENSQNIRIVSSQSLPQDTNYLTLSHRWGNPPKLLLTSQTNYLLSQDITPYLVGCAEAAVFRHAIHVTRGLGYRYIWIDALCIMQDNAAEKTVDIMQMDQVYTNSSLNISASEANVSKGLVFDRDLASINPCEATITIDSEDSGTQKAISLQAFAEDSHAAHAVGPLYGRGWVYQERLLAPRIVHFLQDQVYWECHGLDASEIHSRGYQDGHERQTRATAALTKDTPADELERRWFRLVEEYTSTSLTFPDDRLLAMSALAKQASGIMQLDPNDYLAGLWKGNLLASLVWREAKYEEGSEPENLNDLVMETKVAPSWSWASLMGLVSWPQNSEYVRVVPGVELLDVQVDRISQNLFDGTNLCRLRLRGHMRKFERFKGENGVHHIRISETVQFPEMSEDDDSFLDHISPLTLSWDTCRKVVVSHSLKNDGVQTFFLLHIGTEQMGYSGSWEPEAESGLILQKTADCATYKRAGHFLISHSTFGSVQSSELELTDAFPPEFEFLLDEDAGEYHDRCSSGGRYLIDLV